MSDGVQHIFCSSKIFSKILLYILIEGDVKNIKWQRSFHPLSNLLTQMWVTLQTWCRWGTFFLYLQCHKTCLNKISFYLRFCDMEVYEREFVHYWVKGWLCEWRWGWDVVWSHDSLSNFLCVTLYSRLKPLIRKMWS